MDAIHRTAIINPLAQIDPSVKIGPYTVIDGPVRIGPGVRIIGQAHISGYTQIGEQCEIHPFAAIGGPPQDFAYEGARSYCKIGDRNVIREGVSIHTGSSPESTTVIGNDCMLMANSHVGHNCRVDDRAIIANVALLAGHVHIGHHAVLGGGCNIHQFVRIGEHAMVGGGARISQDVPPFTLFTERNACHGVNRVGLRRGGFSRDQIDELRMLHRKLYHEGAALNKAATAAMETVRTEPGKRLLEFVLTGSKRGIGGQQVRRQQAPIATTKAATPRD